MVLEMAHSSGKVIPTWSFLVMYSCQHPLYTTSKSVIFCPILYLLSVFHTTQTGLVDPNLVFPPTKTYYYSQLCLVQYPHTVFHTTLRKIRYQNSNPRVLFDRKTVPFNRGTILVPQCKKGTIFLVNINS